MESFAEVRKTNWRPTRDDVVVTTVATVVVRAALFGVFIFTCDKVFATLIEYLYKLVVGS
ncbi:MAG: preprotein translocase subunit SecE [Rhodopseudomonas palustris]|nr:preprotein translocase subunit SecE [Rhodopseudomonas palustris]